MSNRAMTNKVAKTTCIGVIALVSTVFGSRAVSAQVSLPLTGPPLGAVFEASTGSLLPLQGVPGSAITGPPLATPPFSAAAVSSERSYAIGVVRDSGAVVLIQFGNGSLTQTGLKAAPYPDRIVLSPAGQSAVLWYANRRQVAIIKGLPGSTALRIVDLTSIDRDPDLFAISDDGTALLTADDSASQGNIDLFQRDAHQRMPYPGQVAALAFLRNSVDALIADASSQSLAWIRDVPSDNPHFSPVSGTVTVAIGEAIGFSRDNTRALLANLQTQTLTAIDLQDRAIPSKLDCRCSIAGLTPLNGAFLFRLNEVSETPVAIVDGSLGPLSISVVPVQRRESK